MKLAVLFGCFLLGLVSGSGLPNVKPGIIEFVLFGASLSPLLIPGITKRVIYASIGFASFFLGLIWIVHLPTWPAPLVVSNLPSDRGCAIIGIASGASIETPSGRYLPVSIELVRGEGFSSEGFAVQEPWQYESGTILVNAPRDFTELQGARYEIHGLLDLSPKTLHGPILLRYEARGILRPTPNGLSITKICEPGPLENFSNRLRYRLMSHLSWGIGNRESELVAGITFGRKGRRLSGNWAGDFYQSGISHLIVASGAQVSLLFLPIMLILSRIRLPGILKLIMLALLTGVLFGFAKLLGGEPSIMRAAAMGTILLMSLGLGKRTFGLATLAAAGWFWLLKNPLLVRDIGFLLSFGACFGIIYLSPPLFEKFINLDKVTFPRSGTSIISTARNLVVYITKWIIRLFSALNIITVSAQISVIPILACTVGRISIVGFIANIFAVPIAQVILYMGALSGIGGYISPAISMKINGMLDHLASVLMEIAHDFATIPNTNIPLDPLPAGFAIAWYMLLILLVEYWRIGHNRRILEKMKREIGMHRKKIKPEPAHLSTKNDTHQTRTIEIDPSKPLTDDWFNE